MKPCRNQFNLGEFIEQTALEIKNTIWGAINNFQTNGNTNHAGAIAFYSLLSIVPLSLLTVFVAGNLFDNNTKIYEDLIWWVDYYYPEVSPKLFSRVLERVGQNTQIIGWIALATSIWFSSFVFGAIETAFNTIFRSRRIRGYLLSKAFATAMIPLCWLIAIFSMVAHLLLEKIITGTAISNLFPPVMQTWMLPNILPFAVGWVFFAIVYKIVPTSKISWIGALTGSFIFCLLLGAAKMFFSWYISTFGSYDIIFGSLEKMIILLIWMFYVAFIFLFCAELIASYERRNLLLIEKTLQKGTDNAMLEKILFRRFGIFQPKGSFIFKEGEDGTDIFYILAGEVTLLRGEGEVVDILGAGKFFGEIAAITSRMRNCSAYASADSDIARIDAATLRKLFRNSDDFAFNFVRELAYKLSQQGENKSS
ncbi:MAG: YihY family inner membrane protein [Deltaproteobacteria bacterium]|nr:YihY family inner membrane protein [Deltaproteobacteria bacterium]